MNLKGINVGISYNITHLFFVDDILIFYEGSKRMLEKLYEIMDHFCEETSMKINIAKSMISLWGLMEYEKAQISQYYPYQVVD
jgi:hypothetical protein